MITDVFLSLFNLFLSSMTYLLPTFSIYPDFILNGFSYFSSCLCKLNFILPMYELIVAIIFLAHFEIYYYGAKLLIGVINFSRGAGEIKI